MELPFCILHHSLKDETQLEVSFHRLLFHVEMTALSCSFSPRDSTFLHVSYAYATQLENNNFVGSSLIRDVASIFSVSLTILQDNEEDDDESSLSERDMDSLSSTLDDAQLSCSMRGGKDLDQTTDSSHHQENELSSNRVHTNSLVENEFVFSYSALPRPRFTRCGRFMTCIANNGFDHITLTELNRLEDEDDDYDGQLAEAVVLKLIKGYTPYT